MTIAEQLTLIREHLQPWAEEVKGNVAIADDQAHLFSLLATAPGAPRIVIAFDTEAKRGEYEELGKVDRKFMVAVSRGRGFKLDPAENLIAGTASGRPLYDLIEEAREMVRGLVFDRETTDGIPDYLGISRITLEGANVDARSIDFTIGVQLPLHHQEETA